MILQVASLFEAPRCAPVKRGRPCYFGPLAPMMSLHFMMSFSSFCLAFLNHLLI